MFTWNMSNCDVKFFDALVYWTYDCDQVTSACQADALNVRSEASIIGCLSLLVHVVPNMSDKILLDVLPASYFVCFHLV